VSAPVPDGVHVRHPVPAELVHDLRTPLAHIIGYSEMLMEQASAAGHLQYVDDLRKVKAAGLRLLELFDENFQSVRPPGTPGAAVPGGPSSPS
jgi:K+-sensing histidine kinase KdpD